MTNTFASVSLANSIEVVRVFIPLQSVDEDCRWSSWKTVIGDSLNLFADSDLREILEEHQITEWTVAEGTAPERFVRAIYQLSLIHGDGPWNVLPYRGITLTQWATIKQYDILSLFFSECAQLSYPGILISPTFQVWIYALANRHGGALPELSPSRPREPQPRTASRTHALGN